MKVEINIKLNVIEERENIIRFNIKEQNEFIKKNSIIFKSDNIEIKSMNVPEIRTYQGRILLFLRGANSSKNHKIMRTSKDTFKKIKEALNNFKIIY